MGSVGVGTTAEGGFGEGENRPAAAHGNDDDIELDRPTAEDGSGWSCGQLFEKQRMNSKINTCGYVGLTPLDPFVTFVPMDKHSEFCITEPVYLAGCFGGGL
jgi:hypothetical protein